MLYEALARDGLLLARDVIPFIHDYRVLSRDVAIGTLVKLRRGVYVPRQIWDAADEREQHILRVRAVMACAERPLAVAGISAAAVWGMPIAGDWPEHVTLIDAWRGGGRSEPGVLRSAAGFATARQVMRNGLPTTDLMRTALDVARGYPFQDAVAAVDWALWAKNELRVTRHDLYEELARMNPRYGRRHLEQVVAFAADASGSFGESRARTGIHLLGFQAPELQAEFRDRQGAMFPDFCWRSARVLGEFDGKGKYTRDEYTGGDPAEVVWREKKREDRLRALGFTVVRILTEHVERPETLARMLAAAGVPRGGSH